MKAKIFFEFPYDCIISVKLEIVAKATLTVYFTHAQHVPTCVSMCQNVLLQNIRVNRAITVVCASSDNYVDIAMFGPPLGNTCLFNVRASSQSDGSIAMTYATRLSDISEIKWRSCFITPYKFLREGND